MSKAKLCLLIFALIPFFCGAQKNGIDIIIDRDGNGEAIASDIIDLPAFNRDEMFVRAVIAAVDDLTGDDSFDEVDFGNRRFSFVKTLDNGKKQTGKLIEKDHATYRFTIHLSPTTEGAMPFTIDDIWITFKDKGVISRTIPLGKLNETNQKQSDFKKQFGVLLSDYIAEYIKSMETVGYSPVTHWNDLENGKIVKGMSELEVKLLKGKPRHIRETGQRVKWMYSNENIIIFTDGSVSSVID